MSFLEFPKIEPNTTQDAIVMYGKLKRTAKTGSLTWLNNDGAQKTKLKNISNGIDSIVQIKYNGKWCFMEKLVGYRNTYEIYGESMVFTFCEK